MFCWFLAFVSDNLFVYSNVDYSKPIGEKKKIKKILFYLIITI